MPPPSRIFLPLILSLTLTSPSWAQHQHQHPTEPPATTPPTPKPQEHTHVEETPPAEPPAEHQGHEMAGHEMQGHDMAGMDMSGHGMHEMPGLLGPYGISRESSGTSWQPESAPHAGLHLMRGDWMLMAHGFAFLVYDDQGGPRGDDDVFSGNMLMGMATRQAGPGRLGLRGMVSLEPATIGKKGYPLLLQTGETADGVTPLVDRQHPHDLFMELAATYSVPLGEEGKDGSVFVYAGLPGEPALGPPAFMHRFSGMDLPEAPLGHHWLDSTHITFGVATLGWIQGGIKLEGSVFTGREPDEDRWDIETPKMDSWSFRAAWNPAPDWSLQVSRGHLHSPEQLDPDSDADRTTASAIWNQPRPGGNWQTTLAWGRNARDPGETTDSYLLESALSFAGRHTVFGRFERQENDELFGHGGHEHALAEPHAGEVFQVGKLSAGYLYDGLVTPIYKIGVGALGSVALVPSEIEDIYGDTPFSGMMFLRVMLGGRRTEASP